MSLITQVQELARPIVETNGAYLIEVSVSNQGREKAVEVFIDTDQGVTADVCAIISRELSQALDAGNLIPDRYHLIVSSPGIDRPLKLQRQYKKHIGRNLSITIKAGMTAEHIQGVLADITDDALQLKLKDNSVRSVEFKNIGEAFVRTAW